MPVSAGEEEGDGDSGCSLGKAAEEEGETTPEENAVWDREEDATWDHPEEDAAWDPAEGVAWDRAWDRVLYPALGLEWKDSNEEIQPSVF